jgi:CRP-like cAMP-binding protein
MTRSAGNLRVPTDVGALVNVLSQFHPVTDSMALFLSQHTQVVSVHRKKLLLKAGMPCRHIYFVRKGVLHAYLKEDNKEITTWISVENDFATSITGLFEQLPSREYIQALEPCELLMMDYDLLEQLYLQYPEFNIISRKLLQKYYYDAENRSFLNRIPKAEQRYLQFLKSHAHLVNRIPLRYIASYIGMTLETLSRIRKKIASTAGVDSERQDN